MLGNTWRWTVSLPTPLSSLSLMTMTPTLALMDVQILLKMGVTWSKGMCVCYFWGQFIILIVNHTTESTSCIPHSTEELLKGWNLLAWTKFCFHFAFLLVFVINFNLWSVCALIPHLCLLKNMLHLSWTLLHLAWAYLLMLDSSWFYLQMLELLDEIFSFQITCRGLVDSRVLDEAWWFIHILR